MRVLVAEDSQVNAELLTRMLEALGHEATVVGNGNEVLAALENERFDAVLLDLNMPQMGGIETSRAIVQRWPPASDRPRLIALTAAGPDERQRALCRDAGMDDYVTKPLEMAVLDRAVQPDDPRPTVRRTSRRRRT